MGRAHLSSQYGIDAHLHHHRHSDHHYHHTQNIASSRRSPSLVPDLPKFLDRPFDLDAELPDGPDVVYEAFLTPDQIRLHEHAVRVPARNDAPSPVESIDTDETTTDAPTDGPPTRVPTPASPQPTTTTGISVLELMEPLSNARAAALPALRLAVAEATSSSRTTEDQDTITPLVQRLIAILRPHISAAIAPFRSSMPDVEFLGHMFERSLILDVLPVDPPVATEEGSRAFPRAAVLAALDAAEGLVFPSNQQDGSSAAARRQEVNDDEDDDAVSDPGMDEEDLIAEEASTTTRARSVLTSPTTTAGGGWSTWPDAQTTTVSLVNRIPRPITISSRSATPGSVMDLDTDVDDDGSSSSSSSSGPIRSVYRTTHIPSFAPRIVRATARSAPYPPVVVAGGRSGIHDRFVPVDRLTRSPSPLR